MLDAPFTRSRRRCGSRACSCRSRARRWRSPARSTPQPGEPVLDLCAAPGGKTTHLAALMKDDGQVVAVERHPGRADALRRTAARMGATRSRSARGTPRRITGNSTACSSTRRARTSARSPRARTPAGARRRRPGGAGRRAAPDPRRGGRRGAPRRHARVLHVHDLARRERGAGRRPPGRRSDFAPEPPPSDLPVWDHPSVARYQQTLPHRDGTDGFFIARMRRA